MIYMLKVKAESQGIGEICVALAGVCEVISVNQVDEPMPVVETKPPRTIRRVNGTTTHAEIVRLCIGAPNNTVTRKQVERMFKSFGWKVTSAGPALSKLERSKKFEKLDDGKKIRLTDLAVTPENINTIMNDLDIH